MAVVGLGEKCRENKSPPLSSVCVVAAEGKTKPRSPPLPLCLRKAWLLHTFLSIIKNSRAPATDARGGASFYLVFFRLNTYILLLFIPRGWTLITRSSGRKYGVIIKYWSWKIVFAAPLMALRAGTWGAESLLFFRITTLTLVKADSFGLSFFFRGSFVVVVTLELSGRSRCFVNFLGRSWNAKS